MKTSIDAEAKASIVWGIAVGFIVGLATNAIVGQPKPRWDVPFIAVLMAANLIGFICGALIARAR